MWQPFAIYFPRHFITFHNFPGLGRPDSMTVQDLYDPYIAYSAVQLQAYAASLKCLEKANKNRASKSAWDTHNMWTADLSITR